MIRLLGSSTVKGLKIQSQRSVKVSAKGKGDKKAKQTQVNAPKKAVQVEAEIKGSSTVEQTPKKETQPVTQAIAVADKPIVEQKAPQEAIVPTPAKTDIVKCDAAKQVGWQNVVLLQGFGWSSCKVGGWYSIVKENIEKIKASGVTHIWLPPPSQSVSQEGYLPGRLYQLDTPYGTEAELKSLCRACCDAGLVPMADIVVNHRCAQVQSSDGTWNKYSDDVDHQRRKLDWDKWAITSNDPHFNGTGNLDTGDDYEAAPDLDHLNTDLRAALKDWLNYLHEEVGYQGWRLDYVKGYGAEFAAEYINDTVTDKVFNVSEYWTDMHWEGCHLCKNQDNARNTLANWIKGSKRSSSVFDFPTKGILQYAVQHYEYWRLRGDDGAPAGLIGLQPDRAVTFIDNHDTGSTQQHWPFPCEKVSLGYAYIMTHPGTPCILWEHYFDWKLNETIDTLVQIRKRNGIKADSKIEIQAADHDMYVAKIADKVVIKLGPRFEMGDLLPNSDEGWTFATSGDDYAIWEKK